MAEWRTAGVDAPAEPHTANEEMMPIRSRVRVLLYRRNVERAEAGEKPITVVELARATGISYAGLRRLIDHETTRVDFATLDKLMQYFGTNDLDDILEYTPPDRPR